LKFPQNQADQADHSANIDVHDPAIRRFICQLLGDTGFEWDHRDCSQTVRHLNCPAPRPTAYLLHAAQVFFRFRLLDIYARVFGFGVSDRVVQQIVRPPGGSRRLAQVRLCISLPLQSLTFGKVYDSLQDWHQVLLNCNDLHAQRVMRKFIDDDAVAAALKIATEEQRQFLFGIQCLCTVGKQQENMKYSKILVNIATLASCVWWFSMVCLLASFIS